NKDSIVFKEKIALTINNYASISNNEYLFRVNMFNQNSYVPKRYRKRKLPLHIYRGYKDVDNYQIQIPKEYVLTFLPENKTIKSKYGTYNVVFTKINDTSFIYQRTLSIKEGTYTKEDYKKYRSFRRSIAKYESLRIAINQK
ncbi:DUF3858 domain-containing protein, partial [Polaribacter sp.]|uniref:DUF3858 domain-containing protein n=1 Tax=Polaribacter sp. TaxID=1920175 RepID=UPI003F6BAE21